MSACVETIKIQINELHEGQQRIVDESARFNVLACGRRFGKTTLGEDLLFDVALEGWPVAWFSPTYKSLNEVWRELKELTAPITERISTQEHRIELLGGGVIDCWSLDTPSPIRGRKYKRVILDEAAQVAGLDDAWQAVIRPTLTDLIGDGYFLSTPTGINFFHHCFSLGQDPSRTDWASWQMPTSVNPYIDSAEIDAAQMELPEMVFRQEYLAEFIGDEGSVFRNIDACLNAPQTTPQSHQGHPIVVGVDWAQKVDYTVICAFCLQCMCEVELDRFNKVEWSLQRARLGAICERWKVLDGYVELNSIGSPNYEALIQSGLTLHGFETTASSKPRLIQSLALALEKQEAQWLPAPWAKTELQAYESRINTTTGRVTYSAPEGQHDDSVIARALAWRAVLMAMRGWETS